MGRCHDVPAPRATRRLRRTGGARAGSRSVGADDALLTPTPATRLVRAGDPPVLPGFVARFLPLGSCPRRRRGPGSLMVAADAETRGLLSSAVRGWSCRLPVFAPGGGPTGPGLGAV